MSLANSTNKAKKFIVVFIFIMLACGLFNIIRMSRNTVVSDKSVIVPDNAFGELPKIEPEPINFNIEGATYEVNTTDGQLPKDLPTVVMVYKFMDPMQSLNAKKTALDLAKKMGFNSSPVSVEGNYYKWTSIFGTQVLGYDLLKQVITLETDLKKDPYVKINHEVLADNIAYQEQFISYLESLPGVVVTEDYLTGDKATEYLILENDKYSPTINAASRADFIKLDYYRKIYLLKFDVPEKANSETRALYESKNILVNVVGKDPSKSFIRGIVGGTAVDNSSVFSLYVNIKPIDYENTGKYRIYKVQDAYDKLTKGEGSLVSLTGIDLSSPKKVKTFSTNDVTLAYYETEDFSKYLEPIYIFTGVATFEDDSRGTFNFYVPAIKR